MPHVSTDLNFLNLVLNASVVVQLVMLVLAGMSVASWNAIFRKLLVIRRAAERTADFETEFRKVQTAAHVNQLLAGASIQGKRISSIGLICTNGYQEFNRLRNLPGQSTSAIMDGVRRAMRATYQRELDTLESGLNFLATVGSVSPYVGLFGTVWGIMNSFRGLANVGQATLANVAPGIAEALVATAIGLFAAIPAVVFYNRFARDADRLANRFEGLMEEFQNILIHTRPAEPPRRV